MEVTILRTQPKDGTTISADDPECAHTLRVERPSWQLHVVLNRCQSGLAILASRGTPRNPREPQGRGPDPRNIGGQVTDTFAQKK